MKNLLNRVLVSLLLAITILPTTVLAGCGHQHTYSSTWSFDETYHWKESTCDHEIGFKGVHQDESKEEIVGDDYYDVIYCIVCGREVSRTLHIHTFNTSSWSKNATHHWHVATCRHQNLTLDFAEHVPVMECRRISNRDYDIVSCSVCGYEISRTLHTHTFSEYWDYDEGHHWHNATCIHDSLTSEYEEHTLNCVLVEQNGEFFDVYSCTTCPYTRITPHQHTYASTYEYDEDYHWHPTTCGHTAATQKTPHIIVTMFYSDGGETIQVEYCSECGYIKSKGPI